MKKLLLTSVIAALGGLLAMPRAEAKNEGLAVLGGFAGGVIVSANLNDHYRDPQFGSPHRDFREPPAVCFAPQAPRGCWKEIRVNTWVPARWVETPGRFGRPVRVLETGHYVWSVNRVWVPANCG